jgi:hypothetical protein
LNSPGRIGYATSRTSGIDLALDTTG